VLFVINILVSRNRHSNHEAGKGTADSNWIGRTDGHCYRIRYKKLGAKLKLIRVRLELTRPKMFGKLSVKVDPLFQNMERGKRDSTIFALLRYDHPAVISKDFLIDEKLDLPKRAALFFISNASTGLTIRHCRSSRFTQLSSVSFLHVLPFGQNSNFIIG
jgi:hypothetical protein